MARDRRLRLHDHRQSRLPGRGQHGGAPREAGALATLLQHVIQVGGSIGSPETGPPPVPSDPLIHP